MVAIPYLGGCDTATSVLVWVFISMNVLFSRARLPARPYESSGGTSAIVTPMVRRRWRQLLFAVVGQVPDLPFSGPNDQALAYVRDLAVHERHPPLLIGVTSLRPSVG